MLSLFLFLVMHFWIVQYSSIERQCWRSRQIPRQFRKAKLLSLAALSLTVLILLSRVALSQRNVLTNLQQQQNILLSMRHDILAGRALAWRSKSLVCSGVATVYIFFPSLMILFVQCILPPLRPPCEVWGRPRPRFEPGMGDLCRGRCCDHLIFTPDSSVGRKSSINSIRPWFSPWARHYIFSLYSPPFVQYSQCDLPPCEEAPLRKP